jgi:hypothetical protein
MMMLDREGRDSPRVGMAVGGLVAEEGIDDDLGMESVLPSLNSLSPFGGGSFSSPNSTVGVMGV